MIDAMTRLSPARRPSFAPELASLVLHAAALVLVLGLVTTARRAPEPGPPASALAVVFANPPTPAAPPVASAPTQATAPVPAASEPARPPTPSPEPAAPRPIRARTTSPVRRGLAAPADSTRVGRVNDTAAPASPTATQTPPSAPPAAPPVASADAVAAWRRALSAWLQAHTTYPDAARRNGDQGRVLLRVTMGPDGAVIAVALTGSAGSLVLDDAALALLRGARLPPAPSGLAAGTVTLTIPVRYHLD